MQTSQLSVYNNPIYLNTLLYGLPSAAASISGSTEFPSIHGTTLFYDIPDGCLVYTQITGLPVTEIDNSSACTAHVFGYHIHEGTVCNENPADPFSETGTHYNPNNCQHPAHAGDLPPLFASSPDGTAWSVVFTDQFTTSDIIGHTVVVHRHPDNFTSQPAGDSGTKIACGVISSLN